jgi:hypothetical protein
MKKTLMSLSAAAIIGAGTIATPQPAHAIAEWIIPTIIAAGVGGAALGVASNRVYYAEPSGAVYVQPSGTQCRVVRERLADGTSRRVRMCS